MAVDIEPELAVRSWSAIGTSVSVVVPGRADVDRAERMLRRELAAIDAACSRFRPDSELEMVHARAGAAVRVSPLLFAALEAAYQVAELTHGAVDPTVGSALAALGYDRDLAAVQAQPGPSSVLGPVAGFGHLHLNAARRTVRIPRGVRLDLGSSCKAWAADRAAASIGDALGVGVLVSLGGDVAVAGPAPVGGWAIGIDADSATAPHRVAHVVAIERGGLASSSTSVRTWTAGARRLHHIVDPATGDCAPAYWSLVSATGESCLAANAVATAAMVWGPSALTRLEPFGQSMRLVRHDGRVVECHGWPADGRPGRSGDA